MEGDRGVEQRIPPGVAQFTTAYDYRLVFEQAVKVGLDLGQRLVDSDYPWSPVVWTV